MYKGEVNYESREYSAYLTHFMVYLHYFNGIFFSSLLV